MLLRFYANPTSYSKTAIWSISFKLSTLTKVNGRLESRTNTALDETEISLTEWRYRD